MSYQIEICANSVQSAINAENGGADRVELCDNLWEGGTTPSMASIMLAKKHLQIPVFVLIRPRGGDFVYSELEFEIIKEDICLARDAGVDGIVSGVLSPDGKVDETRTAELVQLSHPLSFTFHRAFDQTPDPIESLKILIDNGVSRILTSGQERTAERGIDLIKKLIEVAKEEIIILPGGGINQGNIKALYSVGCREFHFSAKSTVTGLSRYSPKVPMNGSTVIPEQEIVVSDPEKIRQIKKLLDELS